MPGDDTRDIDWKVTARVRKPHVRVYTEEKDRPAIYVTDQRLGMFFGSEKAMKSVTAAEAAAIGAWRSLTMGDRPGAVVFNDSEILEVRPQRSQRSVMQALGAVVDLNRRLGVGRGIQRRPGMLNEALRRVASRVTHDALICIISDLDGADAETRRLATELAEHNDLLVAFIYDPLESRLPAAGRLVVAEDALQLEVDTGSAPVRERFAAAFEERLDLVRHILRQRAVPVLPLSSAEDPAEQLRKLLGHRPGSPRAG